MIIAEEQQIEEEVASSEDKPLALFDDRIGAFAAYTIAADLLKLREIYAGYLMRITDDAWARRTERRACGWTLLETLAHLDAISGMFNTSVELALASQPIIVPGITTRSDLRAANRAAID
ncbi:MAG: hypothetical protein HGB28_03155, partial [Oscillochloris sp.]|nr:hypothetical protein [Oscillochloris sp.]